MKNDQRSLARTRSDEKHWLIRIYFDEYCCVSQAKSKSILKNENLIAIWFSTESESCSSILWSDAKFSEIAFSETCIEFCWVSENVSHRALFLFLDFDVMFISLRMSANIWRFYSSTSTDILLLISERVSWTSWLCHSSISWSYCLSMSTNLSCFETCIRFCSMCKSWCWFWNSNDVKSEMYSRNNVMTKSIIAKLIIFQISVHIVRQSAQSYTHFETYSKVWTCWVQSKTWCWRDQTDRFRSIELRWSNDFVYLAYLNFECLALIQISWQFYCNHRMINLMYFNTKEINRILVKFVLMHCNACNCTISDILNSNIRASISCSWSCSLFNELVNPNIWCFCDLSIFANFVFLTYDHVNRHIVVSMSTDILLALEHVNRHDVFILRACQSDITCSKHANQHIVFLFYEHVNWTFRAFDLSCQQYFHWVIWINLIQNVLSTNHCDNVVISKYSQSLVFSMLVIFVGSS